MSNEKIEMEAQIAQQIATMGLQSDSIKQMAELIRLQAAEIERFKQANRELSESNVRRRAEIAALKQAGVVLPERKGLHLHHDSIMPTYSMAWNACLDEVARLNASRDGAASDLLDVSAERNALQRQLQDCRSLFERECADVDRVFEQLGIPADECRTDGGFLNVAKILDRLNASSGAAQVPDVLFDGYAVLSALSDKAIGRTSADNVSDVLDAVVKLLRAAPTPAPASEGACDMVRVPMELFMRTLDAIQRSGFNVRDVGTGKELRALLAGGAQ